MKSSNSLKKNLLAALIMIGYYPNTCAEEVSDHVCDPCEPKEFGRIRSFGFIDKSFAFANDDKTNATEWLRGIEEGKIFIIPNSRGELGEPAENLLPGYGNVEEELVNYTNTATLYDPNYASNCSFYNKIKKVRNQYYAFLVTSSKVHITPVPTLIVPKQIFADDLKTVIDWKVVVKWVSEDLLCPIEIPDGVFENCFTQE